MSKSDGQVSITLTSDVAVRVLTTWHHLHFLSYYTFEQYSFSIQYLVERCCCVTSLFEKPHPRYGPGEPWVSYQEQSWETKCSCLVSRQTTAGQWASGEEQVQAWEWRQRGRQVSLGHTVEVWQCQARIQTRGRRQLLNTDQQRQLQVGKGCKL